MRVLILASWYQNKSNPVRGSFFREQALALVRSGHKVTLISVEELATSMKNIRKHDSFDEYDDNGIRTIIYNQMSFGSNSHSIGIGKFKINYDLFFLHNLKGYRKLYKKLKSEDFLCDVIHAHSFCPAGYAACVLKSIFGVPVIITEHLSSIPAFKLTSKGVEALYYSVNRSDAFYCVSKDLSNAVKNTLNGKTINKDINVIPNILSNFFFYDPNIEKYETFTFISIGNLIQGKRMSLLIEAFTNIFGKTKDTKLVIYGEGVERKNLEQMIKENRMQNYISLPGRLSREELANEMRKCHAFVLPSALETFGVVYIEAMACGLPAIGTLNGGSNEIISDYGGIPIVVDDAAALEKELKAVRYGEYHFQPQQVSNGMISKYGESAVVALLENAYRAHNVLEEE